MPINVIDTIKPKNNGSFPIVEAVDVLMPDGKRLDEYEFTPSTEGSEEITVAVDILPEVTGEGFALNETYGAYMYYTNSALFTLKVGEAYIVVWDGEEWPCVGQDMSSVAEGAVGLGNLASVGGSGNGEPFAIGCTSSMTFFLASDDATSHTIRIYQTTTTTIPTSSAVPAVSAMDNDKVMQVVDGKWTAVPLADSAVKTYIDEYINEALGGEY